MTDSALHEQPSSFWTSRRAAWLFAVIVFVSNLPTLNWAEFHFTVERFLVQTAMEARRDGHWLAPTMEGKPRLRKPPLVTWVTAAAIRPATLNDLSHDDADARRAAYDSFTRQVRWPTLLAACLTLLFIYELGRALVDRTVGAVAMCVGATNLCFLEYARLAMTDVHLMLWVTVADVAIIHLLGGRHRWTSAAVAGIALALAFMSKGPVCLVFAIVPVILWAAFRRDAIPRPAGAIGAIALALLVMLVLGGAWFAWIAVRSGEAVSVWATEVLRTDPSEGGSRSRVGYLMGLAMMMPWSVLLVAGLLLGGKALSDRRQPVGLALAFLQVVVPILILMLFRDRKRYVLPMLGPASVLTAAAVLAVVRAARGDRVARAFLTAQFAILACLALGLPLAGGTGLVKDVRTTDGAPWYPPAIAVALGIGGVVLCAATMILARRRPGAVFAGTVVVMLLGYPAYTWGFGRGHKGHSAVRPLAELIRTRAPGATVYQVVGAFWERRVPEEDLAIYLNRNRVFVAGIGDIPASSAATQVRVELRRADQSDTLDATDWRILGKVPRDENGRDWWVAFVRP
jgi:4-amino-4-deoxy-L-arabinose transferase-like glycosyltransferase